MFDLSINDFCNFEIKRAVRLYKKQRIYDLKLCNHCINKDNTPKKSQKLNKAIWTSHLKKINWQLARFCFKKGNQNRQKNIKKGEK